MTLQLNNIITAKVYFLKFNITDLTCSMFVVYDDSMLFKHN